MVEQIKKVLESVLLISVKNLAMELDTDSAKLEIALKQLEKEHCLRISNGKSCGSSCSSCGDSCTPAKEASVIRDSTIVISLIQKKETVVE